MINKLFIERRSYVRDFGAKIIICTWLFLEFILTIVDSGVYPWNRVTWCKTRHTRALWDIIGTTVYKTLVHQIYRRYFTQQQQNILDSIRVA